MISLRSGARLAGVLAVLIVGGVGGVLLRPAPRGADRQAIRWYDTFRDCRPETDAERDQR